VSEDDDRFRAARLVLALRQAGVMDHAVAEAMEKTPRETFVPRPFHDSAWENVELPIDCGQTLTKPVTAGVMLQALDVRPGHVVLEVGTGSGYVTAVLARLCDLVVSVERYRTLVDKARMSLLELGLGNTDMRLADGLEGVADAAPFDRILVMGSVSSLPRPLLAQLAPDGIIVAPIDRDGRQLAMRMVRQPDGSFIETPVATGSFTPLQPGVAREL
jgi:protein-L-isoaspartate(D-aspartate) O-methyltransferase